MSTLGHHEDKDQKGGTGFTLLPFPGCHKRDLPPPNQLGDVDIAYKLQTWVRIAVGSGQAILQCHWHWQKAKLETTEGRPGQLVTGLSRVQHPQKYPAP